MDLVDRLRGALAADRIEELSGGRQSRAFRLSRGGTVLIAKAVAATAVDRHHLETRIGVVERLAWLGQPVCRPQRISGDWVVEVGSGDGAQHLVVCYEYAPGLRPDPSDARDAAAMGALLAGLHSALAQLPLALLPTVAALDAAPVDAVRAGPCLGLSAPQLLHGDFSADNLRGHGDVLRVFDFDDCGYGPPEFDVANSVYLVLFDAVVRGRLEDYETFRDAFVGAYADRSGLGICSGTLDALVDLRIRALRTWLANPAGAPAGIRDSSREWLATLRSFVDDLTRGLPR